MLRKLRKRWPLGSRPKFVLADEVFSAWSLPAVQSNFSVLCSLALASVDEALRKE